ncbi:MAG: hypothetical protein ACOYNB_02770 [Aquabacterium sp.]|uniref:hypothetical protein n=1 Tax=Aquabacterium sp. TaxID=1872578 RepID=UPI003BD1424E
MKLAGHSCPTVASAYALGYKAMQRLYPETVPQRGSVRIQFQQPVTEGVTGVAASILTLLTGAAQDGGFKGIGGQFVRQNRQVFDHPEQALHLRFTRLDNGQSIEAQAQLHRVPAAPEMASLLPRCVRGEASHDERARLRELWQGRVARLLCQHWDDDDVWCVRPVSDSR